MGPQPYARELRNMRRADASEWSEIGLRYAFIAAGAIAMWLASELWVMLAWGAGYIAMSSAYLGVLHSKVFEASRATYLTALALNMAVSSWYTAMAMFVLTLDSLALQYVGVAGLVGLALHNLGRHSDLKHLAIWDMVLVNVAILFATWVFAGEAQSTSGLIAVLVGGFSIGLYYVLTFLNQIKTMRDLAASREVEIQSQKMRAVGQLTSGVAHDFNNLLTVVRGNLELMAEVPQPCEREDLRQEALAATDRAAHLVAQLMAYARKSPLVPATVPLHACLSSAMQIARRAIPATVEIELADPLPALDLTVDRSLFDGAILNAIINARDAMLPNGGTVTISADQTANDMVTICVDDTGPGMDHGALPLATDPFFTTKGVGEGSGLGLSMIKGFAEQHGGSLKLENRRDGGFRVAIALPIAAA